MPTHLEAYGHTWEAHHPGWEHRLWHEGNMPPLRHQALYDAAELHAPGHEGQFRADIARYELLLEHGGVYTDADMECQHPIDQLVGPEVSAFAGWEVTHRWVNNAILGAAPGHPFLAALVKGLPANVARHAGARPNVLSGPQYLTPLYRCHAHHVTIYPKGYFYPYLWSELERGSEPHPGAYAVHHWHNRRRTRAREEVH